MVIFGSGEPAIFGHLSMFFFAIVQLQSILSALRSSGAANAVFARLFGGFALVVPLVLSAAVVANAICLRPPWSMWLIMVVLHLWALIQFA